MSTTAAGPTRVITDRKIGAAELQSGRTLPRR